MNHLDEGTIHAWLDGALDAGQSREIETHVAACAACSAAVAEARGLIAGASRILSALDDVPAGVIPGGAPAAPQGVQRSDVTPIGSRTVAKRGWRVTTWASGIAAVLVAAIVLSTSTQVQRTSDMSQVRGSPPEEARFDSTVPLTASPAPDTSASSVPVASRRESAPAAPPASAPRPPRDAAMMKGGAGSASVTKTSAANQATETAEPVAQRSAAADVAPRPTVGEVRGVAAGGQRDTARLGAVAAAQQDTTRMGTIRVARGGVVVTGLDATVTAEVERLAGCYRIAVVSDESTAQAKAAVTSERQRRTQAAAPSAAAAPAAGARMEFSGRGIASLIRLDTTRSANGFNVARVPSDSAIGSWRVVGDSARLDFGSRGLATVSPSQKIRCPD